MSTTPELLKIISTTVLDVAMGKAIASGMEAISLNSTQVKEQALWWQKQLLKSH